MNIFKRIENKINKFFEQSMIYNKNEIIIFLIFFFIFIILPVIIGMLFYTLLAKISTIYILSSIILCLILIDADNKISEYAIIIYLLPYIFLLMFLDKIFIKFIPYRGDDPMLLRSYKVRYFKRKSRLNKFKFWK